MRVLVACEYSGIVRDAFIAAGHDAWSCDLLPTESPGPHYQCDVRDVLNNGWDLMIAHPPCTFLSVSGMHWTTRGLRDPQLTEQALEFVSLLLNADIPRIALENPVSVISSRIRKPDQIIQPWWFGDNASKKTCLWLKNLPRLRIKEPFKICPPSGWGIVKCAKDTEDDITYKTIDGVLFGSRLMPAPKMLWANQTPSGQNKLGPSKDRWQERSKTYPGIAKAFAEQWTAHESVKY